MNTPAELWLHHHTDVAARGGEPVFAALMLQIDRSATLTISRANANPTRPQGLVLDGELPLTIDQVVLPRLVLWSDTAPATVSVDVEPGRLAVSHAWRNGDIVHAWTGWAGMVRHDDPDDPGHLRVAASDGHGSLTTDLEVDLRLTNR